MEMENANDSVNTDKQILLSRFFNLLEAINGGILNDQFSAHELTRINNECAWTQKLAAKKNISLDDSPVREC